MESIQLLSFYRSVTTWPRTEAELGTVVEKLLQLMNVPWAAMTLFERERQDTGAVSPANRMAFRFREVQGAPTQESAEEFLKKQLKQITDFSGGLKQLQLPSESLPWPQLSAGRHLTLAPISSDTRSDLASVGGSSSFEAGWLVVGSEKPLTAKEELLLLAAAQKLSELARVSRLENAIQLRGQFLSIASHELKTPLTSIYGILQLQERMSRLKRDQSGGETAGTVPAQSPDQKRSYLKILLRQVERLNELIDGLLDVSRIQNNRFTVEPVDTDVAALVRDTVQSRLGLIAQEAGVKLHSEVPESLNAWVDPVRMEEVVTNLVMNAIRFSPEGGVVWIRLRAEPEAFRLTIRDQGPNVPSEDRERIFQPFERAQRTARLGGLGLGLYISRQIALLHGGNVSLIESVPGKGNVFEAYFPVRTAAVISA
ncbi:MAG: HAMP domain-containing histidine kinase [Oligoflexia bacterium]|nr:HAMP domain-containing histidine kinase [Oligoflexia bacterium]